MPLLSTNVKLPLAPCRHPWMVWLPAELDSLATPLCDDMLPLLGLLMPVCEPLGDELLPMLPCELLPLTPLCELLLGEALLPLDCGYALPLGAALLLGEALLLGDVLLCEVLLPG